MYTVMTSHVSFLGNRNNGGLCLHVFPHMLHSMYGYLWRNSRDGAKHKLTHAEVSFPFGHKVRGLFYSAVNNRFYVIQVFLMKCQTGFLRVSYFLWSSIQVLVWPVRGLWLRFNRIKDCLLPTFGKRHLVQCDQHVRIKVMNLPSYLFNR